MLPIGPAVIVERSCRYQLLTCLRIPSSVPTRSSGSDDKPIDFATWDCRRLSNSLAACTLPSISTVQIDWRLAFNSWYRYSQVKASWAVALYVFPLALLVPGHSSWMRCTARRWTERWSSLRSSWGVTLEEDRGTMAWKEHNEWVWWRHQRGCRRNSWVGGLVKAQTLVTAGLQC